MLPWAMKEGGIQWGKNSAPASYLIYMCSVWQRLLRTNLMSWILKPLQNKKHRPGRRFLKHRVRDSWLHKKSFFKGKITWALSSTIKRGRFPSLSWSPKNLRIVCIYLRHFSLARKFNFISTTCAHFFLLWTVNRMHPIQHLSAYLPPGFSGATHMFTIHGTLCGWNCQRA